MQAIVFVQHGTYPGRIDHNGNPIMSASAQTQPHPQAETDTAGLSALNTPVRGCCSSPYNRRKRCFDLALLQEIHMPTGGTQLREAIRMTLVLRAGQHPNADTAAEATAATWREVAVQLTPVIGARGLDVLFNRALHQTSAAFPWLALAVDRGGSASPLPSLMSCLAGQQTSSATEASYTLLLTFTELLASLIGESLTTRLLAPVWAPPSSSSRQESAS
jgi:hypothetical protein